ncbi:MAG: hypothetical protein EBT67_01730 [Betaproteobacteria bacterium]|nr:hypothetical protein [Betaproteobacteria bacterium]
MFWHWQLVAAVVVVTVEKEQATPLQPHQPIFWFQEMFDCLEHLIMITRIERQLPGSVQP